MLQNSVDTNLSWINDTTSVCQTLISRFRGQRGSEIVLRQHSISGRYSRTVLLIPYQDVNSIFFGSNSAKRWWRWLWGPCKAL